METITAGQENPRHTTIKQEMGRVTDSLVLQVQCCAFPYHLRCPLHKDKKRFQNIYAYLYMLSHINAISINLYCFDLNPQRWIDATTDGYTVTKCC